MATYLVTGATGQQGLAAVKYLLQAGAKVHAVVRNPLSELAQKLKSQGVVIFQGDNDNFDVFRSAAQGCKGLFLYLSPSREDPGSEPRQAASIVRASKEAGVEVIVASTNFYTGNKNMWDDEENRKEGLVKDFIAKSKVEEVVRNAGISAYTIIRPAWFHSNYLLPFGKYHVPDLAEKAVFVHSLDDGIRVPHIDVDDIGRYAAAALLDPKKFGGEEIELANENLTARETWEILRKVSERDVGLKRRSPDEVEAARPTVPTQKYHLWANRIDLDIDGTNIYKKYGIPLTSFGEYLEREKDLLLASLPTQ